MFDAAFEKLGPKEGGYTNDPGDSGGETIYGITAEVARANGYAGQMAQMPLAIAKAIYKSAYWDSMRLDQICAVAGSHIAEELFDTGVNQGIGAASKYLQRALNALNQRGNAYGDIVVDGQIGDQTMYALRGYFRQRGAQGAVVLMRILNGLQCAFYVELVERREKDERFLYGWILNRVV